VRGCPQSPPNRYSRIVVLPLEDGLAVSFRDISKHRAFEIESERRLLKSEEHLRLAAEAAEIGTWDVDPQTGARHWSSHFRNILGLAEEVEPNTGLFSSLIHPKDRDRVNELYRLLRRRGRGPLRDGVPHRASERRRRALGRDPRAGAS
jgi:PAS domain S-box-containing protein